MNAKVPELIIVIRYAEIQKQVTPAPVALATAWLATDVAAMAS